MKKIIIFIIIFVLIIALILTYLTFFKKVKAIEAENQELKDQILKLKMELEKK